jgi:hypothetical protein
MLSLLSTLWLQGEVVEVAQAVEAVVVVIKRLLLPLQWQS